MLFLLARFPKMSSSLQSIAATANLTKEALTYLKNELNILKVDYNQLRAEQLREENRQLEKAVEAAKQRLIQLETANGIKQIPIPNLKTKQPKIENCTQIIPETNLSAKADEVQAKVKPKESKIKEKTAQKEKTVQVEDAVNVGRLDLRVAKIVEVQRHPDADTLYLLKVDAGEAKPRTVCSGLVKHVPMIDLENRWVMLLCNLKPAKMRGILSEAMVMCASTPEHVEVLIPPNECKAGDIVECEGFIRRPDAVLNPKKKVFETVAPDLHTNDVLQACYKGIPLIVAGKGFICAKSLKNVSVK